MSFISITARPRCVPHRPLTAKAEDDGSVVCNPKSDPSDCTLLLLSFSSLTVILCYWFDFGIDWVFFWHYEILFAMLILCLNYYPATLTRLNRDRSTECELDPKLISSKDGPIVYLETSHRRSTPCTVHVGYHK
jgi:hypothetical protein